MSEDTAVDRVRQAGAQAGSLAIRVLATVLALVIFAGLAFLVYEERMGPGPLIFYAGGILGYLVHVLQQRA